MPISESYESAISRKSTVGYYKRVGPIAIFGFWKPKTGLFLHINTLGNRPVFLGNALENRPVFEQKQACFQAHSNQILNEVGWQYNSLL